MSRLSFKNDYSEGCHPAILNKLVETNMEQESGYGEDQYCLQARQLISEQTGVSEEHIYFITIGTQTNMLAITSILRPYEYVIAAETGHIVFIEAGAIEATGHKVVAIPTQVDGKIRIDDLDIYFSKMADVHIEMLPRLLYISNSTEVGAVYTKEEIKALHTYCQSKGMLLYMDGARLASAMVAADGLTLRDLAENTDAFYIGATKAGGMIGEALVFSNAELGKGFSMIRKQRGATLAKSRFLGVQFVELLKDGLYWKLAKHANDMAAKISGAIKDAGYYFLAEPESNQIFPILPNLVIEQLEKKYDFYIWKKVDADFSAIRLITCWATKEENVDAFIRDFQSFT